MTSFQISVSPSRREAARFISRVRRAIQKALAEEKDKSGKSQSDIARALGVHRSVINREIQGYKDMTLGRVAEIAYALGRKPVFSLEEPLVEQGQNTRYVLDPEVVTATVSTTTVSTSGAVKRQYDDSALRVSDV